MDQASQNRNGVCTITQPRVSDLLASAASRKMLWATMPIASPASAAVLNDGLMLDAAITRTPATSLEEVAMKLAMLADWIDETATPSQRALLQSIVADIDRMAQPAATALPATAPAHTEPRVRARRKSATTALAVRPQSRTLPVVRIDRRSRPVTIDGVLFPSVLSACRAYGVPYSQMRQATLEG